MSHSTVWSSARQSVLEGIGWYFGDYTIRNVIIQNSDIQGMLTGIIPSTSSETHS